MSNSALIISGSSGKIGKALLGFLGQDQYDVYKLKADQKLYASTGEHICDKAMMRYQKIDFVHLASPDAAACRSNPINALKVNFKSVVDILNKPFIHNIQNVKFLVKMLLQ